MLASLDEYFFDYSFERLNLAWQFASHKVLEHVFLEHRYFTRYSNALRFRMICNKRFYSARNARIASAVLTTAIPSVRLSVRPSVRHMPVLCQNVCSLRRWIAKCV